jgi:SpoVK/Ycf46/Vps4 family AAA+-type ATPase
MKGYRVLFSGPPGTGKTMTAALMGKLMQRDVYRVDISRVSSKYIGETEKNLSRLFSMAEGKGWVLFFDEADALFGSRVDDGKSDSVSAGHRNEMISYLLQRIENYNGMVVAATNLPKNIDVAFKRRFQEHIHFPLPTKETIAQLWQRYLPKSIPLEKTITPEFLTRDLLPPASINKICGKILHRVLHNQSEHIPFALIDKLIKDEKRSLGLL